MDLVKEKINQAIGILNELDIDLWIIFVRESDVMADPAMELVVGHKVVWQSAFFYSKSGATKALIGSYDAADFERSGSFGEVRPYVEDCGKEIRKVIKKFAPKTIALNYSINDISADGLSHGMFLLFKSYLKGTPFQDLIISSENIIAKLRGRKTPEEINRLKLAAELALECWDKSIKQIQTGMTEIEIGQIIDNNIKSAGASNSFTTIVNAGAKTTPDHGQPTDAVLEPGDLLHVDFGAILNGYCSDIQRLAYFVKDDEKTASTELIRAFNMVRSIIDKTSELYTPGKKGYAIDKVARQMLKDGDYKLYQHALGHQIGRSVHDGGAIIGSRWKRYGAAPMIPLEKNNAFTVELGIELENIGYVGLEEDLIVTEEGGKFLCPRQLELIVK